jgi:hypothetical protein
VLWLFLTLEIASDEERLAFSDILEDLALVFVPVRVCLLGNHLLDLLDIVTLFLLDYSFYQQ